jgi:hypothetical protein
MPERNDQESKAYSKSADVRVFDTGNGVQEFIIIFDDSRETDEPAKATVRARLDANLPQFIQFEVALNEIPVYKHQHGKDVMVDWHFPGMDFNKKLFYSANGL